MKQKRLIRDFAVLALFAAVVFLLVAVFIERQWQDASEGYILNATQNAAAEFQRMTDDVEKPLAMVREWGGAGRIKPSKPDEATDLLFPFFGQNAMLSGISIASTKEPGFFILPDGTVRLPGKDKAYTPAERPWFAPALETDGPYWTGVYRFHTLGQLGITASIAWGAEEGAGTVAAFDILLDDFIAKIRAMAPTPASHAFIFSESGELYAPASGATDRQALQRRGILTWMYEEGPGQPAELKATKMLHQGKTWWCGFVPLEKSGNRIWMGVLVPEGDIIHDIALRRAKVVAIGCIVFLMVAFLYGVLVWRRRVPKINTDVDEQTVRALIAQGENRSVEFKSTMRMNLHSKKPGKEIELAWLKGVAAFLNTDGGTLLLGVTDAGEITGIEQDVFENEDKCRLHFKNLVARHIGTDLSKYIRFILVPVEGKTVGVVRCARSTEPVFLKDGNKEHFYIRNGPSSDELPVSQALNYIKRRK